MSKSDDDCNKIKFEKCIKEYLIYAKEHEKYCRSNCFDLCNFESDGFYGYPHTRKCKDMATMHCNSFVECKSLYCLNYNDERGLVPSYSLACFKKKIGVVAGSMYLEYVDNQEDDSS